MTNDTSVQVISVNGEQVEVPIGTTITQLLERLHLENVRVAVEKNREVVPKAQHATESLASGDTLEVVRFVGGG